MQSRPISLLSSLILCALCAFAAPSSRAASIPPAGKPIDPTERTQLEEGLNQLGNVIHLLEKELAAKPALLALLPDVQIYHKAVEWPLKYNELLDVTKAKAALAKGMERARQLRDGKPTWVATGGVRAYVSKIDGSIQPYLLVTPKGYNPSAKPNTPCRLDFFFHGRSETLTELNFISGKTGEGPANPGDHFTVLPYGRYCNANKFAGEIDTLEILEQMKRQYPIDDNRVIVTGFSMGGAACWHIAVHYADLWAAASPGAGFAETRQYQKMDNKGEWDALPWYQKKLMHLYDCPDYALNLSMCPTIAYAGEIDPQQQSGDVMAKAMADLGLKLERIYGPNTAHKYEKNAKKDLDARLDAYAQKGRDAMPREIHFETWTLRYNRMRWLTIDALERHWDLARIDAMRTGENAVNATTRNIDGLTFHFPAATQLQIDGQSLSLPAGDAEKGASIVKSNGKWAVGAPNAATLRKRHGLQGPVDDAFLDSFVIVRPTGQPLNDKVGKWAASEADYATNEWRKIFRGVAPTKKDDEVTGEDIANSNLVLFGDPSSNAVLKKIADRLPIKWTKDTITLGERTFPADRHALIAIYPNPLNPQRYVVLNSGFTFRQADHKTNSRQIAKLPDYAVVDLNTPADDKAPGAIPVAGFFDEAWQLQKDDGRGAK